MNLEKSLSKKQEKRIEGIVGGLRESAQALLDKLCPEIENGSYDVILGVDASGRIPTLLLAEVIRKRYQTLGYPPLAIRFVAGGGLDSDSAKQKKKDMVQEYITKLEETGTITPNKKILLVDDTFLTGTGISPITEALHKSKPGFDVAIFASPMATQEEVSSLLNAQVYTHEDWGDSSVAHKHDVSGVKKDSRDLFASRRESKRGNAVMQSARKMVHDLANELYARYEIELAKKQQALSN